MTAAGRRCFSKIWNGGKITDGPPIIATNSGADRITDISRMARAAGSFLFLLIGWELDGGGQPNNPHKSGHTAR
jgi:hypothetical protein